MKKLLILSAVCAFCAGSPVYGVIVNVSYNTGTVNSTTALTGFTTSGDQMSGMTVTASFSNGSSQTAIWGTTGAGAGGAFGTGWSLIESGDTFGGDWTLSNTGTTLLTRLLIDAGPGNSLFDTTAISGAGTNGSANGLSFTVISISAADTNDVINATYLDAIGLGAAAPVGDLFRRLDVTFADGLSSGSTLRFEADTDNLLFAGDIAPVVPQGVPDAMSTLFALGSVSTLLGFARRYVK